MPQSAKILTTACQKPAVPLEDHQRQYGRVMCSTSPQRSKHTQLSLFPPSCMVQRHGFPIESLLGHWSSFINTACAPSLASNGKTTCRRKSLQRASVPSIESILLQVQLRWAGHVTRMEDVRMPKAVFFSELREGKRDRGAPRKRYKDQLKRQLAQAGTAISHGSRRPQTETAGAHQ